MKTVLALALFVTSVLADGSDSGSSTSRRLFASHDLNHDHCLNVTEFDQIFLDMDTWPEDKRISEPEFREGWVHSHLNDASFAPLFFSEIDHNNDNEIEESELRKIFTLFDVNHNGCATSSEFSSTWSALFNV